MQTFGFGSTLSRTFELLGRGFGSAGVFLLIAQVINAAFNMVLQPIMLGDLTQAANPADPAAALAIFSSVGYWGILVFGLAIGALMYAGSIHGYLRAARGDEASLAECLEKGVTTLLPMLGLTLLWWIGISLGFALLVVPGAILLAMWAAAMPAMVGEGTGVIDSFGRSRELTRGHRLKIFLLLLLIAILLYVIYAVVVGGLIGGAVLGGGMDPAQLATMTNPLVIGLNSLVGWAVAMLLAALVTAIYLELVQIKDGTAAGPLAGVFE